MLGRTIRCIHWKALASIALLSDLIDSKLYRKTESVYGFELAEALLKLLTTAGAVVLLRLSMKWTSHHKNEKAELALVVLNPKRKSLDGSDRI